MANDKEIKVSYSITGVTVQVRIKRETDGFLLDDADGSFGAAPADSLVDLTEHATIKGLYELTESRTAWDDGKYTVAAYVSTDLDTIIASGQIEILDDLKIIISEAESQGSTDGVWNALLRKDTYNDGQSAGKRLRDLGSIIAADGTIDDPSPTDTSFITDLTSTVDGLYVDQVVVIDDDTDLIGQSRVISEYDGTTKRITVDEAFSQVPLNGSDIIIYSPHVHPVSQIVDAVWDELLAGHVIAGSFGEFANLMLAYIQNKKFIQKTGSTWFFIIRNAGDTADILNKALKDKDGNDITDPAAGILAVELASSV